MLFTVFGSNGLLHFIKLAPPSTAFGVEFQAAVNDSHFMVLIFVLQLIAGLLLLVDFFVPLALVVLAGILTNILLYHVTMDPSGIWKGIVATILWFGAAQNYRANFCGLFPPRATPTPG